MQRGEGRLLQLHLPLELGEGSTKGGDVISKACVCVFFPSTLF